MMMPKAEVTFEEQVLSPPGNYCAFGHDAPEEWYPEGKEKPARKMKFIKIKGSDINLNGKIVCECCIIVANYISDQQKKEQEELKKYSV